jgi:VanZ family protein
MKLSHRSLHALRLADLVLFWPVLALVIVAELAKLGGDSGLPINDKLAHFSAYFLLGAMAAAALKHRPAVLYAVLGLILLGGVLEIIQPYFGRDRSFLDEVANTAGAMCGAFLARLAVEPLRRRFT